MKIPRRARRAPLIPVNAMADIAFLLLVFIMLISLINYRREPLIEYPEARAGEETVNTDTLHVWIDAAGGLYLDGAPASITQVEARIADEIAARPSVQIQVIADRRTPYRHVSAVIEILQLLQHRAVALVVRQAEEAQ